MADFVPETVRASSKDVELTAPMLPAHPSETPPADPRSAQALAAIEDPVVRHGWVAQRWHELSGRLTPLLGRDHSWCAFATWRSLGLGRALHRRVDGDPAVAAFLLRLADHEAAVLAALGPRFERLARCLERDGSAAIANRSLLLEQIGALDDGPIVRVAFSQYLTAAGEADEVGRSQRVLAANLLLVRHEQELLQVRLQVPARRRRLTGLLVGPRRSSGQRSDLERARWNRLLAEVVLTVPIPGNTVDLTAATDPDYPSPLRVPTTRVLVETLDMWADARFGLDEARRVDVARWLDLAARMRALERLYRSHQRDRRLAGAPFGRRELEALRRLQRPAALSSGQAADSS